MALLSKELPTSNFFRGFNGLAKFGLTHRALVVYLFLCELAPNRDYSDKYILKALGMSANVLALAKKELREQDLLCTKRVGMNSYRMYIGYPKMPASEVARKDNIERENDRG